MGSEVVGSFETTYGDLDTPLPGKHQLNLSLDGKQVELVWLAKAGAGTDQDANPRIRYVAPLADGRFLVAELAMPASRFSPGRKLFHGLETGGTLITVGVQGVTLVGFLGEGAIELSQASAANDAPVVGSLQGRIAQFACADL
jgi:hypothetical protein